MKDLKTQYDLICLVTNDITTDRRMLRTCSKFASIGWKVLLIGRTTPESKNLESYTFDTMRVSCYYSQGPMFYFEILRLFRKVLKTLMYKNLLCTDLDTIGVLNLMNTDGVTVYFDAHEYFTEVPELSNAPIKKLIWSKWGRAAIRKVDKAYTVGPELAKILGIKYQIHFDVIRNVPESTLISSLKRKDKLLFLVYLGVLNPGRGLALLIDVVKERKDVHLKIIGDGPLSIALRERGNDCDWIEFSGEIQPSELPAILAKADVGVNLLVAESKSYYYSLANKFFDYLHAGLPVLCMNYPEYKSIAELYDCIYPTEVLTKASLHGAIDSIDKYGSIWEHKIQQTKIASNTYNWKIEGQRLLKLYDAK